MVWGVVGLTWVVEALLVRRVMMLCMGRCMMRGVLRLQLRLLLRQRLLPEAMHG